MYEVTIFCLANSRKPPSGRCIAGKRFEDGNLKEWIRPVSARPGHEVSEEERRYESGTKAQLLDIIRVPLAAASPSGHQTENHILDADHYWTKEGTADWDQVKAAVDPHDANFWSHSLSTHYGINDKVAEADVKKIGSSLKLILVPTLEIRVRSEAGYEDNPARRKVRGKFSIGYAQYLFSITDPKVEEHYLTQGNGDYQLEQVALCISLSEVWKGFAFRLIASIITPDMCKTP